MRVKGTPVDPNNPQSIIDQLGESIYVIDGRVEFGEPLDPNDSQSVVLAGGAGAGAHNGTPGNIWGSWVETEVMGLDVPWTCIHNLYLEDPDYAIPVAGRPNVRWVVFGFEHDGTGAGAATGAPGCFFQTLDAVAVNSIELRFYAAGLTVDQDHPLKVTLFFTRASR